MLLISTTILEAFSLHHNLHQKYPYHTSLPHCVKIYFWEIILWSIHRHWSFDTFERSFPNCIANLTCEESLFICKRIEIVFLWVFWSIDRCARCMYTGQIILMSVVFSSQGAIPKRCPLSAPCSNHTYKRSFLESEGRRRTTCSNHTVERSFHDLHVLFSYCIPKPCTLP